MFVGFLSRGWGRGLERWTLMTRKPEKNLQIQTSFFILTSACVLISLIACAVSLFHIKNIGPVPNRYRVNTTIRTRFLAHFLLSVSMVKVMRSLPLFHGYVPNAFVV